MMQLNDILEENSIQAISKKTKIPEENLETLFANKFEALKRVKAMGFISIIEREYEADLKVLRTAAKNYYDEFQEENSITLEAQSKPEKKGKSKLLFLVAFILLGLATWYFLTQSDKQHFEALLEFIDHNETVKHEVQSNMTDVDAESLSISAIVQEESANDTSTVEPDEDPQTVAKETTEGNENNLSD